MESKEKAHKIMETVSHLHKVGKRDPHLAVAEGMNAIGFIIQMGTDRESQLQAILFARNYLDLVEKNLGNRDFVFTDLELKEKQK
jgi:hypothetical protein